MLKRKIAVLVSGRGSNLQAIMDSIASGELPLEIAVVISDKPDAYALERAAKAGIPAVGIPRKECKDRAEFEARIHAELIARDVELIVLAGFMRIISGDFVAKWEHRIINIHPAILPSFPGMDGQGQALDYGVKVAGCTVHFVDAGTDTGPIILQKVVPAYASDTHDSLADRILVEEHKALPEALKLWSEGALEIRGRKVYINNR